MLQAIKKDLNVCYLIYLKWKNVISVPDWLNQQKL